MELLEAASRDVVDGCCLGIAFADIAAGASLCALASMLGRAGQLHSSKFCRQPLQTGFFSSHFFFRRRQVKHPVRLRDMVVSRVRVVLFIPLIGLAGDYMRRKTPGSDLDLREAELMFGI